jgi:hypothetical protein
MSIAAISASSYANYAHQSIQSQFKQFQQQVQQLAQDLQSGNVKSAQQELTALQQLSPLANSTSTASGNPLQQAFQNQTRSASRAGETHHALHHHGADESSPSDANPTGSDLVRESSSALRQYSSSNNLSAAQQAYTGFQNFQDFGTTVPIETSPLLIGPSVSFAA